MDFYKYNSDNHSFTFAENRKASESNNEKTILETQGDRLLWMQAYKWRGEKIDGCKFVMLVDIWYDENGQITSLRHNAKRAQTSVISLTEKPSVGEELVSTNKTKIIGISRNYTNLYEIVPQIAVGRYEGETKYSLIGSFKTLEEAYQAASESNFDYTDVCDDNTGNRIFYLEGF